MPITKSAKKAIRGSSRKRIFNNRRKRTMKDAITKLNKTAKTDKKSASDLLNITYKAIDKAAKSGIIKKNNAARKKSRLAKLLK